MARKSFYDFVRQGWAEVEGAPFVDNWHVGAICEHLQAVTAGQIRKLLINIPPGLGKSLLTSVFWPAWEWANDPTVRWFFASYDQRLSMRDSVRCRALIHRPWFQSRCELKFRLTGDQNQKAYYETDQGGYRLATSVGGHGSGEHPDRIVCDDPHNVQQAESPVERQAVLDWWDLTMTTRGVARNARRVIIMQRLHEEDMSGHVLAKGDWVHICLPMRYEKGRMEPTPLGFTDPRQEEGELLTPNQFDEGKVTELESNLGAYGAAGQLQQSPVPRAGGMFRAEFFKQMVRAAPYAGRRIRYWDRAATADGGCYTAGTLLAKSEDGIFFVENVVHGQWEPDTRDARILATARKDRARYGPNHEPVIWIEQEPGSSGVDSYKYIAKKLAGFRVFPDKVTGAKEVRAEPWASQCAALNVRLVDDGSWDVPGWIHEHCLFPMGKLKDRVDSASGAFGKLINSRQSGSLYVRSGRRSYDKRPELKIVLCSLEQLSRVLIDQPSIIISIADPAPVGKSELPAHGLTKLLGSAVVNFADIQPADYQEKWEEMIAPYDKPAAELAMQREHAKKIWSVVSKNWQPSPEVIVVQDNGGEDRRAISIAFALCDKIRRLRSDTICRFDNDEWKAEEMPPPPNRYIFDMVKSNRC